jgi:hypothetical protein
VVAVSLVTRQHNLWPYCLNCAMTQWPWHHSWNVLEMASPIILSINEALSFGDNEEETFVIPNCMCETGLTIGDAS